MIIGLAGCTPIGVLGEVLDPIDSRGLVLVFERLKFGAIGADVRKPAAPGERLQVAGLPAFGRVAGTEQQVIEPSSLVRSGVLLPTVGLPKDTAPIGAEIIQDL